MCEYIDAIIIILVINTNAVLGVIQEVKAGKAIEALQKMSILKAFVEEVMHEFKEETLRSGKNGKVKSRKQAIAIGISEAKKAGLRVPT